MADQEDQDFSKLPLDERIAHKNWKARASAYEELAKLFPTFEQDKEWAKFSPLIKKFVLDANAAAQEKGLAAVLAYVDYCPVAGRYIEPVVAGVATKCLNSTRAKTKELAVDIVLLAVEIERQEAVLEELIKALEQKTPKNVAAVVRMITRALNQFGSKVIAIKPIVPTLGGLLEHKDPGIREETKQLCIEIYRWVKDALLPQLSNLKPILLDALKEEFEKVKGAKAVPERLLRSQQQRAAAADEADGGAGDGAAGDGAGDAAAEDEEADPFELLDPVDILAQLPSDFYPLLEAKKWQERKDALEKLQALLEKHPKLLATADYGELVKQLKRIIGKDTNIVVATAAIKCLSMLCTGLRKGFDKHAHGCVTVLLEKFKEKKANVVASLREAIDAVYLSTNMEAIQEDLTAALDNKNPSIRSETALFMARAFAKTNPGLINKKLLKVFVTSLLKTLGDSDPTVRESSAEALGTAAKAQGDRNMGPLLQGLEQLKMAKIEEYKAKVEVKKFAALPPPTAAAAASSAPASASSAPKPRAPARKPAGGGARVVKPPSAINNNNNNYSSAESLDMPDPPAPKFSNKPGTATTNRFGAVKSRLDTGNARGGSAGDAASAASTGKSSSSSTLRRPGASGISRLGAKPASASVPSLKKAAAGGGGGGGEDPASSALMLPSRAAKEQRLADERSLKVLKWNFSTPREEFYVQLREQMEAAGWAPALVAQCFHADFKFHIKAIDSMSAFFGRASAEPVTSECLLANVDLVLKWAALRFFDTNPSVIMKALDLLRLIFAHLEAVGYSMSNIEANSFLPYLVTKSGDAKDVVRAKVRDLLHTIRSVYAPAKIFAHLMDGLSSKNARQRTTCLEEIAGLIESEGMAIFSSSPSSGPGSARGGGGGGGGGASGGGGAGSAELKDIAKCVSERDTSVRNAALACIVKVYQYRGEDVYKLVGALSDKDMSLIEERIKRVPKSALKMGGGNPHADTNGGSGLPTLGGGGGGGIPTNRFGGTLTRQPMSAGSNLQYGTPESQGTHPDLPRGGTLTKGTISKIGSLTNVSAALSVAAHTPTNHFGAGGGGGGGSPYDTYAKPRGNTGTISKARSMIGLGLGPKANSLVGFGLNRAGSGGGTPLQSRLAFSGSPAAALPVASGGETSDTESGGSGINGFGEQQQMSSGFAARRSIGSVSTATTEHKRVSPARETLAAEVAKSSSSMSVVSTSTEEWDDLDRRVREALADPVEVDPQMMARIRSKFGSTATTENYRTSPARATLATEVAESSSSMSVVTASTDEWDDLDRRVREELAVPVEVDPEMMGRIRNKYGSPGGSSTATYGVSPPGLHQSSFRSSLNGSYTVRSNIASSSSSSSTPSANHHHHHPHHQSPLSSQSAAGSPAAPALNPELSAKISDLFAELSSGELGPPVAALEHLNHLLAPATYDAARYGPYLEPKLVQLVALLNKQLRLFLSKHHPEAVARGDAESRAAAETTFRAVALTIANVFRCPLGRQVNRDTLRELITHLLPFFLEEMKRPENKAIFDSVNLVIQEVIRSADSTNFLSALIRMLHDYVGSLGNITEEGGGNGNGGLSPANTADLETFLSLTMKFIWRIVKFFDRHYENMKVEVIMLESHLFFKSYPRSWWRSHNRDDLPLRTIKTLVYLCVRKQGDAILEQLNLIQCMDESELSYYVQKSLRQCEASDKAGAGKGEGASKKPQQQKLNSSSASTVSSSNVMGDTGGSPSSLKSTLSNGSSSRRTMTNGGAHNENDVPQTLNGTTASSLLPRTHRPDFPLPTTRQLNNGLATDGQLPQPMIPVIRSSEDLRVLCEYTSRTLNMPQLNYAAIEAAASANAPALKTVADAEAVVAQARGRFESFKARLLQQQQQQQERAQQAFGEQPL